MSQLRDIQRAFQASLQRRDDSVAQYIEKPSNMNAEDRLRVYYNDYFFRLRDSLKEDYKKTCQWMGEAEFETQLETYVETYPSSTYTLREIGYHLPTFFEEQNLDPAIVELSRFECEVIHALYSPDAPTLTMDDLAAIDPEQWANMRFQFHPSIRKIMASYNTLDLWLALEIIESKLLESPSLHLIWRYKNSAYFRFLNEEETRLFHLLESGRSFSDVCEKMLEHFSEEEVVSWVAGILQAWIPEGLFSSLVTD